MGKVIAVVSGKGGTGKTTTAGAIASCLAVLGHRTLCLDCDAGLRNLDITLGMSDYIISDFSDVLEYRIPLEDACIEHPKIENLFFLPAPAAMGPDAVSGRTMGKLADEIRNKFDYCFIDSPAGIGAGFRFASSGADTAIVVVTPDTSSIRDGQRVIEELRDIGGIQDIRLLVNRVKPRNFRRVGMTVDDIIDTAGAQLIGLVSEDENVTLSANLETPLILYETGGAARQFLNTARRLAGEEIPLSRIKC